MFEIFGTPVKTRLKVMGTEEKLFEILAFVIILIPISSVCGISAQVASWMRVFDPV